jgi:hypothetical protein
MFASHGVALDGAAFITKLGSLVRRGTVTTGSLTDIVGIGRNRVNHSWHQDSGLDQVGTDHCTPVMCREMTALCRHCREMTALCREMTALCREITALPVCAVK